MLQQETTIVNKFHARASAKLTQLAGNFQSEVWMTRNGRKINAKSIMGVMMLAAGIGSTVTIETEGRRAGSDGRAAEADRRQVRRRPVILTRDRCRFSQNAADFAAFFVASIDAECAMLRCMQSAGVAEFIIANRGHKRIAAVCRGFTCTEEVRVSFTLHGIPVSRGIAIGRAYLIAPAALDVAHYLVEANQIDAEVERFRTALEVVHYELEALRADLTDDTPSEVGAFIDVHAMILSDEMLVQETIDLIRTRRYNVEWALTEQLELLTRHFDDIEDEYLRERKADIEQVVERVLKALAGAPSASQALDRAAKNGTNEMIVVAHDIAPADMMQFKSQSFQAFVTDLGGRTSHGDRRAQPRHSGRGRRAACERADPPGRPDHRRRRPGIVIVDPAPIVLEEYSYRQSEKLLEQRKLQRLKFSPTQTLCGTKIDLYANIELPDDAKAAVEAGAVGVGLFRSEFLFASEGDAGRGGAVRRVQAGRRVDEGHAGDDPHDRRRRDKPLEALDEGYETAPNPRSACARSAGACPSRRCSSRSCARSCASAFGQVKILIPMLAHAQEIDQTLDLIREAKRQLDDAGPRPERAHRRDDRDSGRGDRAAAVPEAVRFPVDRHERPDQHTLAIDRADNAVAHLYDPLHPAVLHLIAYTLREAKRAGVSVSVCGEMAGTRRSRACCSG